jgi:ABC-type antimicrobial peptide transport system permease subunit
VFKGLGMTQGQIRLSIACRILFTALTGIVAGIPAGLFAAPKLVNIMFKSLGIIKFPFFIDPVSTFLIIPFCLLIAGVSAWMPSGKVKKLNPRNLIVE